MRILSKPNLRVAMQVVRRRRSCDAASQYVLLSYMKRYLTIALLAALPCLAQVDIKQQADRMDITINGAAFSTFFYGAEAPKPYLHPLRTASGKIVTRAYPMENVEGESKDHPHHRGLWFTHGDVNGFDFWANEARQKGPKKGKIVLDKAGPVAGGKKTGHASGQLRLAGPAGQHAAQGIPQDDLLRRPRRAASSTWTSRSRPRWTSSSATPRKAPSPSAWPRRSRNRRPSPRAWRAPARW